MDNTDIELASLYTKMHDELEAEVAELGGHIDEFEPDEQIISVEVDPKYQEYLETIIATIIKKYDDKRKAILQKDAFFGVKLVLDDIDN